MCRRAGPPRAQRQRLGDWQPALRCGVGAGWHWCCAAPAAHHLQQLPCDSCRVHLASGTSLRKTATASLPACLLPPTLVLPGAAADLLPLTSRSGTTGSNVPSFTAATNPVFAAAAASIAASAAGSGGVAVPGLAHHRTSSGGGLPPGLQAGGSSFTSDSMLAQGELPRAVWHLLAELLKGCCESVSESRRGCAPPLCCTACAEWLTALHMLPLVQAGQGPPQAARRPWRHTAAAPTRRR